ncbi:hypothetical protein HanXRQr2_Chr07g0284281 [Helianthus annuus]|uniref:Uncharacterized protein n=1 Tax=Helianthus annuus TaxID=4232 RepID=A0A9K3IJS1_HELAN|nr:hypothetical protein HanXRQr2_Chr07g0284281 [Helianthus annuus]KAJ0903880.1 hypothetical protein HanPSC8_Chr07g0275181 [Helianthus annuus]
MVTVCDLYSGDGNPKTVVLTAIVGVMKEDGSSSIGAVAVDCIPTDEK